MAGINHAGNALKLAGFASQARFMALHTADPTDDGLNELSGGFPEYERLPIVWSDPANNRIRAIEVNVFNVPAMVIITHGGYWSEQVGGTFYGSRLLDSPQPFPSQGTYTMRTGFPEEEEISVGSTGDVV